MSEERKLILKMLKEDKISEDEALKLLDAIGSNEDIKTEPDYRAKSVIENTQHLADKLASSVDKVLKKTSEQINKFEFDYDYDLNFGFGKNKKYSFSKFKKELTTTLDFETNEENNKSIIISNFAGDIDYKSWDQNYIQVVAKIKYNDRYVDENYQFFKVEEIDNSINITTNSNEFRKQPFKVSFEISLPVENITHIEAKSVDGDLAADDIVAQSLRFSTVNGDIDIEDSTVTYVKVETTNGDIDAINIKGSNSEFSGVNGDIVLKELNHEQAHLTLVNGDVVIEYPGLDSKKIEVETLNGEIYVNIDESVKPIKVNAKKSNKYTGKIDISSDLDILEEDDIHVSASTKPLGESIDQALEIDLKTLNGKIIVE